MHRPMVMQEATVEAIRSPVLLAKVRIFCRTTSRQPALLIIPAKQNAQNTSRVVPMISAIPPRFNSLIICGAAVAGSKPGVVSIEILKPFTVASSRFFRLMFWKINASAPARTVEAIITGRVGFLKIEPARISSTGRISRMLKLYMPSS